ncbi:hypothetical protein ANCCAN_20091 [Ancylostoma caninum]|uniref:Uncharacterized protein n=1 Tax=Ancylostoma caninum TaxID=29170 RepID=A0A368FTF3_ANCCA|nr:hypothetical protein ANCCAN_20091 [Ancylostoma caninum]
MAYLSLSSLKICYSAKTSLHIAFYFGCEMCRYFRGAKCLFLFSCISTTALLLLYYYSTLCHTKLTRNAIVGVISPNVSYFISMHPLPHHSTVELIQFSSEIHGVAGCFISTLCAP